MSTRWSKFEQQYPEIAGFLKGVASQSDAMDKDIHSLIRLVNETSVNMPIEVTAVIENTIKLSRTELSILRLISESDGTKNDFTSFDNEYAIDVLKDLDFVFENNRNQLYITHTGEEWLNSLPKDE